MQNFNNSGSVNMPLLKIAYSYKSEECLKVISKSVFGKSIGETQLFLIKSTYKPLFLSKLVLSHQFKI